MEKKSPQRMCIACKEMRDKKDLIRIVKSHKQVYYRCFACARRSDYCYHLSRLCGYRNIFQYRSVGAVTEGHTVNFNKPVDLFHFNGIRLIELFGIFVKNTENTLGS